MANGAQAVQLFDTWGGILTTRDYMPLSLEPMRRVIAQLTRTSEGRRVPIMRRSMRATVQVAWGKTVVHFDAGEVRGGGDGALGGEPAVADLEAEVGGAGAVGEVAELVDAQQGEADVVLDPAVEGAGSLVDGAELAGSLTPPALIGSPNPFAKDSPGPARKLE